ncbi:MAG TPA: hypothetical protein VD735_02190 [Candidatus Saccharimonadales bacterium]|nr:hypothetical protein [Candidatus Saccharimonadales bacterium]
MSQQLPDPATEAVRVWLKSLSSSDLKNQGWIQVNREFHGIAMAMRPFLQSKFPDPLQRAAAFDGLVAGLMTLGHFKDIEQLTATYGQVLSTESASRSVE